MHMAIESRIWTLEELHALPEDGNKYELLHGELLVTPAPTDGHETIAARLTRQLDPFVAAQGLGYVYRPRAVMRVGRDTELEPDLMIRQPHPDIGGGSWDTAPLPILVVEILSRGTRAIDLGRKRVFYLSAGVAEYWVVDGDARTITVHRQGVDAIVATSSFEWNPPGSTTSLVVDPAAVFP